MSRPRTCISGDPRPLPRANSHRVMVGDIANTTVAQSSNHGTRARNILGSMTMSSCAPAKPPTRPTAKLTHALAPCIFRSRSCAITEVSRPGQSATWLVVLASFSGSPMPISAGKVTSVPPPASALIRPPAKPATARTMMTDRSTSVSPEPDAAASVAPWRRPARRIHRREGGRLRRAADGHGKMRHRETR